MLSLAQGQCLRKEAFVEKHVALITPSTSFLDVYEDKMSVSEIYVIPSVWNRGLWLA